MEALSEIVLPQFKEAAFRGAFGYVFKKLVCAFPQQEKCHECILFNKCAFSIIFSPGATTGDAFLKNLESIPRPFTVHIINKEDKIPKGKNLQVQILIVGRAMEYFPYVFLTIKELGKNGFGVIKEDGERGKYEIKKVTETMLDGEEINIYSSDNPGKWFPLIGFSLGEVLNGIDTEHEIRFCRINFESPVRLKKDGRIAQFADFRSLIRSIITRVNALTYYYGDKNIETDVKEFLEEADKVSMSKCNTRFVDYRWHSGRQKTNIMLGGLVGEVEYRGNITPFYPYLKCGELLGVGKNTTFGFGRVKVQV